MFSAFTASLFTATTAVAWLRTGAFPRWLAIAGLPFAVLMLLNAVMPMAAVTLWFVAFSITLAVRPARRPAVASSVPDTSAVAA